MISEDAGPHLSYLTNSAPLNETIQTTRQLFRYNLGLEISPLIKSIQTRILL
jgi:hypothetical protein